MGHEIQVEGGRLVMEVLVPLVEVGRRGVEVGKREVEVQGPLVEVAGHETLH